MEVPYLDRFEFRTIDLGRQILQVIAVTFEFKRCESGKDDPCYKRAYSVGRDSNKANPMGRARRWGDAARPAAIASGEMYPDSGIL